jgi:deazaflavin-dependent oxidoreductase (nitroreductase family)
MTAETEQSFNAKTIAEFRANGGRVGGQFEGFPLLLLTSIGARSGQIRVSPVARFDIDGSIYIVGSAAGRDKNPGWVANIRGNPQVKVEIGDSPIADATAEELPPDERDRIFGIVKERAPGFAGYEAATSRVIPVFEIKAT